MPEIEEGHAIEKEATDWGGLIFANKISNS